jgi:hypothetical protein
MSDLTAIDAKLVAAVEPFVEWSRSMCPPRSARANTSLEVIEAEPFEPSTVHAAGVAVYHLGNNGTARALLKEWALTNS